MPVWESYKEDERVFYCAVLLGSQWSRSSQGQVGAGMKAISSLALTKCELCKSLESLLLLNSSPSAAFTYKLLDFIISIEHFQNAGDVFETATSGARGN